MDSLLRALREGRTANATAPLALVTDTLQTIGGRALFLQAVLELWNALQGRRTQARGMVAVLASLPRSAFDHLAPAVPGTHLHVVSVPEQGASLESDLIASPVVQEPCSVAVVLDDLSELVDAFGFPQVIDFLHKLVAGPNVSCVFAMLHEDTLPAHEAFALQSMCMCQAALRAVDSLVRDLTLATMGHDTHAEVSFSFNKRATGRVRVEKMLYYMTSPHAVALFKPPEAGTPSGGAKDKGIKVDAAAGKEPLLGSMRLDLNAQERAAKEKVVLPYQHQGEASVYQSGNFKEYLPVAAGGHGGSQGKLGHVMYVRDSDDQYDSDEDPDDDLDF